MKRTVFILNLLTIFALLFSSCKKDTTGSNIPSYKAPATISFGKMSATIYGKVYNFNITTAVEIVNGNVTSVRVVGQSDDLSKTISLQINNVDAVTEGSYFCGYKLSGKSSSTVINYSSGDSTFSCDGTSKGKIGFTTISNSFIRGVFHFDAINLANTISTITISGEFNATHNKIAAVNQGILEANGLSYNIISAYRLFENNNTSLAIEAAANNGVDNMVIIIKMKVIFINAMVLLLQDLYHF